RQLLVDHNLVSETIRFAYLGLEEPPKAEVLAHTVGASIDRRVRAVLLDMATGRSVVVVASLTRASIDSRTEIDAVVGGQPPIGREEFIAVDEIVKAAPGWVEAVGKRGIPDLDLVRPCPLSAGNFGFDGEAGRRMLRVYSFLQNRPEDHCWAHPIDGLVAYVDLTERKVLQLIDSELLPVPSEAGNFD